ncbi:MAG: hypothetical protein EAZ65_02470 [Verrucomicrobia bacterium]|nr:MAG: hypothetical protein EAZ84_04730 [Verrucomicrobiota bacterium]TAE88881.1 MAG: hypothetical protein EAZ82_02255 [Verrucomicrobiota bacterium]TAF27298.1 MAG: hypothetical protein EAZ71_02220 [Verrucomicrobiota bacterium]TAF42411.1 MAG: hypothetical protein EAZ65_02470 [Verrucomicrobiota bacterium]
MNTSHTLIASLALLSAATHAATPHDGTADRDPLLSALHQGFGSAQPAPGEEEIPSVVPSLVPDTAGHRPSPKGIRVSIEPGKNDGVKVDPSAVKLLAPFPAKPLTQAPAGWKIQQPETVPAFARQIRLENGTEITLSIRPHLLVPAADGRQSFAIQEPGYNPTLGYAQTRTLGAILGDSLERMDEDSRRLGESLDQLEQLLSSLPPTPTSTSSKPSPKGKSR